MKRKISIILALAMMLSLFAIPASATKIIQARMDAAADLSLNKDVTITVSKEGASNLHSMNLYYKINHAGGLLRISVDFQKADSGGTGTAIRLYDSTGKEVTGSSGSDYTGSTTHGTRSSTTFRADTTSNRAAGAIEWANVSKGTYYVTFSAAWTGAKFTIRYGVPEAESFILSVTLKAGDTLQLGTVITPSGTGQTATWSSSKPEIASISAKGRVTAKSKGNATITAKVGGQTQKIRIRVT